MAKHDLGLWHEQSKSAIENYYEAVPLKEYWKNEKARGWVDTGNQTLRISDTGKVQQIVTNYPAKYYADQEVLVTCNASGSVSAWFHVNCDCLFQIKAYKTLATC